MAELEEQTTTRLFLTSLDDIILKDLDDPLVAIIDSTYPDLLAKSKDIYMNMLY